jgi:hypothetical protein
MASNSIIEKEAKEIMACGNHTSTENQITDEIAAIIREMDRNGIKSSGPQSDILKLNSADRSVTSNT